MTHQNRSICRATADVLKAWAGRATARPGVAIATFLLGGILLQGQITNVSPNPSVTATQAIISYTAPDSGACSVEVREGSLQGPLVHDVDPSLFPGSNLDSRAANVVTGRNRIFVVGKRAAELAIDQRRYSRALQADTAHAFRITCSGGAATATGQFTTMNPPLGAAYNDPLPVDPDHPGQYAWPSFSWTDRTEWVVDPFTGFRIKQFDSTRDAYQLGGNLCDNTTTINCKFVSASDVAGNGAWTNPSSAIADDSAAATYSGTSRAWLFAELGLSPYQATFHSTLMVSMNTFVPTFNAWCSSGGCNAASAADRTIEYCLTVNGTTCASDLLSAVLTACTSNCTGAGYRFDAINNPHPILAEWFSSGVPSFDITNFSKHSGGVTCVGANVTWAYGDRFDLQWTAGSKITISGTVYTIASVAHDSALTLTSAPTACDSYTASNAGVLIRKKSTSTDQISIQYVSYAYETEQSQVLEPAGDEENYANCSPADVAGPNGENGWHCQISGNLYWIGQVTGTVNRLGRLNPPYNGATDGWRTLACPGGAYWDWNDGNTLYCQVPSNDGHQLLVKMVYSGDNSDTGDSPWYQTMATCGSNAPPCWTITNLTAGNLVLDVQMAAFHPLWAATHFQLGSISIFGRMGPSNSLSFIVRNQDTQNTTAFVFRYDLNSQRIVGAVPTWGYWPMRWSGSHGPGGLNDPAWTQISATNFRGPFTGTDYAIGNGPYYSTVTSGAFSSAGQPCPSRPSDSPIPSSDWPTGNQCILLTVDGEPGDPTPATYSSGTISVNGTAVTGNGVYWTPSMDGVQMRINGTGPLYTFHYGSNNNTGTLSSSPGSLSNVPYTLYLEPINNPAVGNPNFAFLQNAAVRDVFCATNNGNDCVTHYETTEFMRLLVKNGNTWTLQRAFAGKHSPKNAFALNANAWLIAYPSSCYFDDVYPCAESRVYWNALTDPYGYNASGDSVLIDPGEKGCCHATRLNAVNVNVAITCPTRDYVLGLCYFARFNGTPAAFTDPGYLVTNNPPFHGLEGVGSPNAVDTHPSHNQTSPPAQASEMGWIGDARTFLGGPDHSPTNSAGTPVGGTLYKFSSTTDPSAANRLRPRILPTMASCGANPLLDVSAPGSSISTGAADNYKYCVALRANECQNGSSAGDVYVNCPQIHTTTYNGTPMPQCVAQGIGNSDPETRDICVVDMGAHTLNTTQVSIRKPDPDGANARRVTSAFSRYRWLDPFWNVKILPNGRWMLVWSFFFQGQRNAALMVKLPPFPANDATNRGDFLPHNVSIPAPKIAGVTNAVVQFGYDKNYFCTSRREACLQGAVTDEANMPFHYQSENPAGVPCTNGCTIAVHALPQRILYYQVLLRNANNNVVGRMVPQVAAIP